MTKGVTPKTFLDALTQSFDKNELRRLCFSLGIEDEDLPQADTRSGMAVSILKYVMRRGQVDRLVDWCAEERPFLPWSQLADALSSGGAAAEIPPSNTQQITISAVTNSQINIAGQNLIQSNDPNQDEPVGDGG